MATDESLEFMEFRLAAMKATNKVLEARAAREEAIIAEMEYGHHKYFEKSHYRIAGAFFAAAATFTAVTYFSANDKIEPSESACISECAEHADTAPHNQKPILSALAFSGPGIVFLALGLGERARARKVQKEMGAHITAPTI